LKWPEVSLLDALASAEVFVDGDWVESKDQDPEGDVRLVQLADVGDGEYVDKSDRFLTSAKADALRCTFLKPGDVLVARMPDPLGRACIFPGDPKPSVTVVDVCIIRPDAKKHDARWLMRCLNAPDCRNQIAGYATGTTRSRISRGNLGKIRIPLPPLPEQQRIAKILDKADALRCRRSPALAQHDTLTQSIFLDMFGDPVTNPKGWPRPSLEQLLERAEVFVDGDWVESKDQDPEGEVRLIQLADVGDGVYLDKSARFLTKQTALRLKCTPLEVDDILVARMPDPLGRACLFPGDQREAVTVVDVCIIRTGADGPHPVWLMCCINTAGFRSLV